MPELNQPNERTCAMPPCHSPSAERSACSRAIEFLADDTHLPVSTITEIYDREFAKLALEARIQTHLPLLVMRKVREQLSLQFNEIIRVTQMPSHQSSRSVLQWCPVRNKVVLLLPSRPAERLFDSRSQYASGPRKGLPPA